MVSSMDSQLESLWEAYPGKVLGTFRMIYLMWYFSWDALKKALESTGNKEPETFVLIGEGKKDRCPEKWLSHWYKPSEDTKHKDMQLHFNPEKVSSSEAVGNPVRARAV